MLEIDPHGVAAWYIMNNKNNLASDFDRHNNIDKYRKFVGCYKRSK